MPGHGLATHDALVAALEETCRAGDTLLFKGSHGMHMEQVLARTFENERTYGGIKMEPTLIWILVSVLGGCSGAAARPGLVPALRALKAGQSIREVGPKWHQGKSGTPTMGGIVFILSSLLCIVTGWHAMRETGDYKHLLVLALALMFGLIGFCR